VEPKPLFDDPSFQASLSKLDRGLSGAERGSEARSAPRPGTPSARPPASTLPGPPPASSGRAIPSIFPESALLPPPPTGSGGAVASTEARPLLDLFPPRGERFHTPGPTTGARTAHSVPRPETAPAAVAAAHRDQPASGVADGPFTSNDPKFVYHTSSFDRASQELLNALGRGHPIVVLTGEKATGKTTLCRLLLEQLGPRAVTSFITNPVTSFDELLKTALVDFGVASRAEVTRGRLAAASQQELTGAVGDFAASLAQLQASAVIVVDEAQNISADVLEPLSDLADIGGGDRRVQLILVGQPTLSPLLHRAEFRSVERRIAVRSRLDPMTREETMGYVAHRLAVAGGNRVEFEEAAIAALHEVTHGLPGLVNLVCDRVLARGEDPPRDAIDEMMIASAAREVDLAPSPSSSGWITRMAPAITMAVGFVLLMLVGAGAAAWVFRDEVSRLLAQW